MPRYELSEGTSNKFWEIELEGDSFTVCYGRIGTNGQTQTKSFADAAKAKAAYDKLVKEKTGKGYAEVGGNGAAKSAPAAKPAPAPVPAAAAAPAPSPPVTTKVAASVTARPAAPAAPERAWILPDEVKAKALPSRANPDGTFYGQTESLRTLAESNGIVAAIDELVQGVTPPLHNYNVTSASELLRFMVKLPEAEWQRARDHVVARHEALEASWDQNRVACAWLAHLVPEVPALAERDLERTLGASNLSWQEQWTCFGALSTAQNPDLLERAIKKASSNFVEAYFNPFTALVRLGPTALPLLERSYARVDGNDPRGHIIEAFGVAPAEQGLPFLFAHGEERAAHAHLVKAVTEAPDAVVRAALPMASRAERPTLERDLVELLVRQSPAHASVAWNDGQRALVDAVAAEQAMPQAPASALPKELASPPWKGLKIPKPIVVEGLVAKAVPEAMAWPEGLRDKWANAHGFYSYYRDPAQRAAQALRAFVGWNKTPETTAAGVIAQMRETLKPDQWAPFSDCTELAATCDTAPLSGHPGAWAFCVGDGEPCEDYEWRCEGDTRVTCLGGRMHRDDCTAYLPGTTCQMGRIYGEVPAPICTRPDAECWAIQSSTPESCEGSLLTLCVSGERRTIDCRDYGYATCDYSGCVP